MDSNNCSSNAQFADNSDKGDLRIDFVQNDKTSWFLKISDRKENAINFNTLPEPLDSGGNGNGNIRILDRQVALGYTHLIGSNKVLDARLALSGTKAGKYSLAIGNTSISFPGLPTDPTVAGGLPTTSIGGGFSAYGRQNTNPQWQNPSLLDPKVNFSWVKGKHSLKLGFEYEHIWMEVQDSNPLYGSFGFGGGYSRCPSGAGAACSPTSSGGAAVTTADNYWADFLFGTDNQYALATYFKAHLLQTMLSGYGQDDWKVNNRLTLNLGLRWEYGSPYSEANNNLSNFDPATQTMLTLTPGYSPTTFIKPYSGSGVYGKTLVNPSLGDFAPRLGFAYSITPSLVVRGGFGMSYVHYTRAGSGDILAINAPSALFVTVSQNSPLSASTTRCPSGAPGTSCFATWDQGFPTNLTAGSNFSPATDNITYVPKDTKDSYVESYFLSIQKELAKNTLVDIAYIGSHGVKLQGFLNANQQNPALGLTTSTASTEHFLRPYMNWGAAQGSNFVLGDITEALNGFYSHFDALQVKYEQRFVAGLTLLNSFTWEHSLDNASASLEGNTPAPQNAFNLAADYGQSDYNLPVANITSLVYDLPVGRGHSLLSSANPLLNAIAGGWQISAIDTLQSGTPFNVTYSPSSKNLVSPQISSGSTWRGINIYRPDRVPGQPVTLCNSGHSCLSKRTSSGTVGYINTAAFSLPATLTASNASASPFGDASRNPGRTPGFWQTDIDLNKRFNTPVERVKVEFRAEAYNIFNHTNLYLPSSSMGSAAGSTSASTPSASNGTVSGTFEPRILQFGLKVVY